MNISIRSEPQPVIQFEHMTLRALQPVLNGALLVDARARLVRDEADTSVLCYSADALGGGTFCVEWKRADATHLEMRYWIENLEKDFVLDSFGIHFPQIENVRAFLRNGYFSWDGSEYVECTLGQTAFGYAMTQLLPRDRNGSVVIGFDRHDRYQHTFTFSCTGTDVALTIETLWDRKARAGNERCESETLVLFEHPRVEDALREWANRVAAKSPLPPRHVERIVGWCSWYNLYAYITEENILAHLRGVETIAKREQLPMRVFQIDDGFTPEMGDWLDVKPQFPRGLKPLLDDIRAAGFVPGLWIAPFMVGNRSRLFREHPDWVVRERETGQPLAQMKFYGEFRWHKRSEEYYILDPTHPAAFEYLRHVFRVWRHEWGCEYFKTDFMHFGSAHGASRALFHTPGMTRMEIWRRVAEMIRQEIGDAMWLGCGCPLWASVGLVDAVRIGRDVGVMWEGGRAASSLLRDGATRNFANGILWQADPDCILLRERFHDLSDAQVRSLALLGGLLGGVLMTSDALQELSAERLQLWKFLAQLDLATCRFPLLGTPRDDVIVQVRRAKNFDIVFLFNTSDATVTRVYAWDVLGLSAPQSILDWNQEEQLARETLAVTLDAYESALFYMQPQTGAAD